MAERTTRPRFRKRGKRQSADSHVSTSPLRDASRGPRIQKYLAEAGVASRRECEEMIERGEVSINGHIITELPIWVDPAKDRILVQGRLVKQPTKPVYIMLYKPRDVVSTNEDPEGRKKAIDLVKHPSKARLFPVGRLDMDSTGLLLLTNDGELANRLTHPRYGVHKQYDVTVKGQVSDEALDKMSGGVFLTGRDRAEGSRTQPVEIKILRRDRERTHLLIELREGRNRQIRRMLAKLDHPVKRLRRVKMGPLKLTHLKVGQWRELEHKEVVALKRAAETTAERKARRKPTKK